MPRINTPESKALAKARTIDTKSNRSRKYAVASIDFDALLREVNAPRHAVSVR